MKALALAVTFAVAGASLARADANDEARAHYTLGAAAYERGDYAAAVREFTACYELSKKADILFNIARAETKLLHEAAAIARLKEYLTANPDASDLPSVKAEIEARETALAAKRSADSANAAAKAANAAAEQAKADADQAKKNEAVARASAHPKWPAAILFGLGGVAVAGGVILGALAEHNANLVQAGSATPVGWTGSAFAGEQTTGKNEAKAGLALDIVGGALLVAGGGLLIWALRGSHADQPKAWLSPTTNGFAAGGTF